MFNEKNTRSKEISDVCVEKSAINSILRFIRKQIKKVTSFWEMLELMSEKEAHFHMVSTEKETAFYL